MNFVFCWINVGILLYLHYEEVLVQEHFIWTNLISFRYGGGGIRTHGALADTLVFKTRALNHSTTPPGNSKYKANFVILAEGLSKLKHLLQKKFEKLNKKSHWFYFKLNLYSGFQ